MEKQELKVYCHTMERECSPWTHLKSTYNCKYNPHITCTYHPMSEALDEMKIPVWDKFNEKCPGRKHPPLFPEKRDRYNGPKYQEFPIDNPCSKCGSKERWENTNNVVLCSVCVPVTNENAVFKRWSIIERQVT